MKTLKLNPVLFIILELLVITFTLRGGYDSKAPDINYTLPTAKDIKVVLDRVKDHLEVVTPYYFYNRNSGKIITDYEVPEAVYAANLPGDHQIWSYEMGVTYAGMVLCAKVTGDLSYLDYAERTYKFIIDHLDYIRKVNEKFGYEKDRFQKVIRPQSLDDCGSMGAALIKVHGIRPDRRYLPIIDVIADYISNKQLRLKDGTLARKGKGPWEYTLWTDDLYMSVPFLTQMGKLSGDKKYFDDAVKQVIQFSKHLFIDEKGIFDHGWFSHTKDIPHFFWGRQNGWAIMAIAELLSILPENYRGRDKILDVYHRNVCALTELQSRNGLWHQMLDKEETYLETSCSAMFTFAIARGVNEGWIEPMYGPVAIAGWRALEGRVMEDGQIEGVCTGTSIAYDMVYYANRPQRILAYHGYGPVLLAGAEVIKMLENFDIRVSSNTFQFFLK